MHSDPSPTSLFLCFKFDSCFLTPLTRLASTSALVSLNLTFDWSTRITRGADGNGKKRPGGHFFPSCFGRAVDRLGSRCCQRPPHILNSPDCGHGKEKRERKGEIDVLRRRTWPWPSVNDSTFRTKMLVQRTRMLWYWHDMVLVWTGLDSRVGASSRTPDIERCVCMFSPSTV